MTMLQALDRKEYQQDSVYSPPRRRVTEAEYWEKYYEYPYDDVVYEWHNGYLEEKPVSDRVTYLTHQWFMALLNYYLEVHPIAKTTGLEMGFRLVLPDEINIRRPDTGVVLNDNPVPHLLSDKSYKGRCDMCIEAISESTDEMRERDTVMKKDEYAEGGVREYYILDGNKEYTCFYRLSACGGIYVPIKTTKKGLIKSKVLPGFQFRVTDLYACPSQGDMIEDDVYKGFVSPDYSEAKQQAREESKARQKAEAQARKESKARQKAEAKAREESKARQKAEAKAREERKARQKNEAEIIRLKSLLAKKDF